MTDQTITVTLRLFAQVRVSAGQATVAREVAAGTTAGELAATVLAELDLSGMAGSMVLAVNGDWADPSVVLTDGVWLSLVPPVSGGAPGEPVVDVVVTQAPLDTTAALAVVADPGAGGTVLFQGTPRDVDALEFEAHEELAQRELGRIGAELVARHGLRGIALHHRLGLVPAGESALLVVAAAAHRGPAFDAAKAALDEIKQRVPIWKAEVAEGRAALVQGQTVVGPRTVAEVAAAPVGAAVLSSPGEPDGHPNGLTHLDASGAARMVDVSDKAVTDRSARAVATIRVTPHTAHLIATGSGPKGEVLATARLAGIMAAKRASDLVPLAHPLPLTKVDIIAEVDEAAGTVSLEGFARTTGKTGVEIEALTAVLVAALVVYDMVKAVEQHAIIDDVRVVHKAGGRRDFTVDGPALPSIAAPAPTDVTTPPVIAAAPAAPDAAERGLAAAAASHNGAPSDQRPRAALSVAAVHVSTSRTAGTSPDRSRDALAAFAARTGWKIVDEVMVTDDRGHIAEAIAAAAAREGVQVVLTLGGTGVTPDDVTPDATADVIDRTIPGLAEALRAASLQITPLAALSRGTAGAIGPVVIVNLPGSPKALAELEPLLSAILPHAVSQLGRLAATLPEA